jgi:hypothetical protein
MVDNRVVEPIKGSAPKDAQAPPSYVTDGIVKRNLDYTGKNAKTILDDILPPLGLAYSIQKGFVWITTPEKIKTESFEPLVTLYYTLPEKLAVELERATVESNDADSNLAHRPLSSNIPQSNWEKMSSRLRRVWSILPMITEPDTKKELSFIFYNINLHRLIVHNTPENHNRLQEYFNSPIFKPSDPFQPNYTIITREEVDAARAKVKREPTRKHILQDGTELITKYYDLDEAAVKHFSMVKNWNNLLQAMTFITSKSGNELSMVNYNQETKQLIVHNTEDNHDSVATYLENIKTD